jgi:hypothetical protein
MSGAADLLGPLVAARASGFGLPLQPAPVPANEPGWRAGGAAAGDAALMERLLERTAAAAGTPSRVVAATWQLEKHTWFACAVALGGVLVHGRVPPLAELLVRDGEHGWVEEIALPARGWEGAGGARLATSLEAHLAPLVRALSRHRAERALWRSAGDRLGQAAHWCGEAFGEPAAAAALATDVLESPTELRARADFGLRDGRPFRRRTGCCLSHRCPGGVTCDDCVIA